MKGFTQVLMTFLSRVTAYPCGPNMPRRNEENVVDKMGTFFYSRL